VEIGAAFPRSALYYEYSQYVWQQGAQHEGQHGNDAEVGRIPAHSSANPSASAVGLRAGGPRARNLANAARPRGSRIAP